MIPKLRLLNNHRLRYGLSKDMHFVRLSKLWPLLYWHLVVTDQKNFAHLDNFLRATIPSSFIKIWDIKVLSLGDLTWNALMAKSCHETVDCANVPYIFYFLHLQWLILNAVTSDVLISQFACFRYWNRSQASELLDFICIGKYDVNNRDTAIWALPKDYYLSSMSICLGMQIN